MFIIQCMYTNHSNFERKNDNNIIIHFFKIILNHNKSLLKSSEIANTNIYISISLFQVEHQPVLQNMGKKKMDNYDIPLHTEFSSMVFVWSPFCTFPLQHLSWMNIRSLWRANKTVCITRIPTNNNINTYKIVFSGLIYMTPNTHIHDRSLSCLDIGTSVKRGGVTRFSLMGPKLHS
jgi:hypothetical protein